MGIQTIPAPSSAGKQLYVQKFTTEGTNTFTLPSGYGAGNPLVCEVTVVGGGGGAGGMGYNTSNGQRGGGGGGGGGAVFTDIISLTSNATAFVGSGGLGGKYTFSGSNTSLSGSCHGGQGEHSWFGVSTGPVNFWPNPQCEAFGGTSGGVYDIGVPFAGMVAGASSYTGALTTSCFIVTAPSVVNQHISNPVRVLPSTQYTLSFYMRSTGNASSSFDSQVREYSATGTNLSNTTLTTTSCGTTWTRRAITLTTTASTKYIALLVTTQNFYGNQGLLSNIQLELGGTATTYKDGISSGYNSGLKYFGNRFASATFSSSDNIILANGGGGGAGSDIGFSQNNSVSSKSGFPGGNSGGGSFGAGSGDLWKGGNGGGAGGHATVSVAQQISTSGGTAYETFTPGADMHFGTSGVTWGSNQTYAHTPPGPGLNGFGKGGYGFYKNSNIAYSQLGNSALISMEKAPNTGDGGDAFVQQSSGTAQNGASGIVIVKYWA